MFSIKLYRNIFNYKNPFTQYTKRFYNTSYEDDLYDETRYNELFIDTYIRPIGGNCVYAIQPDWKFLDKKFKNTTPELRLYELVALVESIPNWRVEDKALYSIKQENKSYLFGKGQIENMKKVILSKSNISAVVIGIDLLNSMQLAHLQQKFSLPVYDRYTIVLQIFQSRAKTNEAKLQVALAEIPYLKSRLHGMHSGVLDKQIGSLKFLGGSAEVLLDTRLQLLRNRELKIKGELDKLSHVRLSVSNRRKQLQLPTVAVVGYTNAGKTSLIKSLSGDKNMHPRDQLFATLDITTHSVSMGNGSKMLLYDTVGFITDMPPSLLSSFHCTLQDIAICDVLVHVRDASHPDASMQDESVRDTLRSLPGMDGAKLLGDNLVVAHNKVDLLSASRRSSLQNMLGKNEVLISVKDGFGLSNLLQLVEESVNRSTGRIHKIFKVPSSGPIIEWLYKESIVESVACDKTEDNKLLIRVLITPSSLAKFNYKFKPVQRIRK